MIAKLDGKKLRKNACIFGCDKCEYIQINTYPSMDFWTWLKHFKNLLDLSFLIAWNFLSFLSRCFFSFSITPSITCNATIVRSIMMHDHFQEKRSFRPIRLDYVQRTVMWKWIGNQRKKQVFYLYLIICWIILFLGFHVRSFSLKLSSYGPNIPLEA